jgi:hypothetical protein
MSLLQVGVPLGVFLGYVMTAGIVGQLGVNLKINILLLNNN